MHIDGHELALVSYVSTGVWLINRTFQKGWVKSMIHRQPIVAMSCFWGCLGITLPLVVPKIRYSMGLPTNQYYGAERADAVATKYW